ncbi:MULTISPECIES: carboxypeptidase-like regulatory domain-containing protein [Halorubrum]|uniref:Carboxypeptidase regulatory-like domain-containing protein n=1 Tax=Halorubrum ruber TaxID=2982524 RepID=A0A8T8LP05_9EURY|nr:MULTISPECIES: carboxypeptidase-like regulatory domain-containing protein [Halorubrum]QUO48666.1 carboxypeptidase regulatory-like domain-containing protein [Halorubrum ruber]
MSTLRIYDTKGNAYSPDGTATGSNEQIKELFYGGVRLAIRSDHRQEISLFFRARESRNARTEQFYAVYSVDNSAAPLQDLISDLTTRIESEWGYTIDESSDEMQVYRELKRGNTAVPGDSTEQDILAELITSRSSVTVGVSDERNAIGLLSEYLGQYDQAAVADSMDADVLSTFDLVVTPGDHRGITPLGATEERWESTSRSLRDKHIKQEIASIRESVETLSRDYGLSNGEIRKRVQSSVPALKPPATSSNLGSRGTQSDDDSLLSPEVGLYIAIGAVVLLVLFAAVTFGPSLLGLDSGDAGDQSTVSGALIDNTTGQQLNSSTGNISVILRNENGLLNTTDQPTYNFSVNETLIANATLVATADGYEEQRLNISEDRLGGNISLDPTPPADDSSERSRVEGAVIDSNTSEGVAGATVVLTNSDGGTREATTESGGTYSFENITYGEYTLSASATGYVASDNRSISVNSPETQLDNLTIPPQASLSVRYIASNTNESLTDGRVRLIDRETGAEIDNTTKGGSAWYNNSNVDPGQYTLELSERSGYENKSIDITLTPGETYQTEVTVQCTAANC